MWTYKFDAFCAITDRSHPRLNEFVTVTQIVINFIFTEIFLHERGISNLNLTIGFKIVIKKGIKKRLRRMSKMKDCSQMIYIYIYKYDLNIYIYK